MHPTIRIINRLSKKEQKRFLSWLRSELYHNRKALTPLAELLLNNHNRSEEKLEEHWRASGQKVAFRPLLSHLGTALEKFLATEDMMSTPSLLKRHGALAMEKKQLKTTAKKIRKKKNSGAHPNLEDPQDTLVYDYLILRDELDERDPSDSTKWSNLIEDITPFGNSVDELFIFHKLQQACRLAVFENFYETASQQMLFSEVLTAIEQQPQLTDRPIVRLYYLAYLTLAEQKDVARNELVQMLFEHIELLQFPPGKELFVTILNHGISQLNKGDQDYLPINLDLYEIGLKTQLIFRNQRLSGITFYNIFFLALKLKRLEWAGNFLDDHQQHLSGRDQLTIYPYCRANWYYERKELDKASDLLIHYEGGGNVPFQLQGRITLAKVYYDQHYFDLLDSHLNSTTVFISRNEHTGYHGEIYLAFIKLLKKLLRRPVMPSAKETKKLKEEINTLKVLSLRDWLLERV